MSKASAQFRWFYAIAMLAAAACAGWIAVDAYIHGANAADFVALALLAVAMWALYRSNRHPILAGADACDEDALWTTPAGKAKAPAGAGRGDQWTPEERAEALSAVRRFDAGGRLKEYRQGDWLVFLPAGAQVEDFDSFEDGSRWVRYRMPSDPPYNSARKAQMALIPQRAADAPAVRAEFDGGHATGLVVEEVGDDDDGFTPVAEDAGPGVIEEGGSHLETVIPADDTPVRRLRIDQARRKRHNEHWLAHAERTGKLDGEGAILQHILSGADAAPVAKYLEHAKQLVQRAEEAQRLLTGGGSLDTPLGQALVTSAKTAQEGATLTLALVSDLASMQEQRDELACRLIQHMPDSIRRNREQSYYEGQADEREAAGLNDLTTYTLAEDDKLEGVGGHTFWTRADVLVPASDLDGRKTLRVVDETHGILLGFVHRQ